MEHVLKQLTGINGKLPFVHIAGTNGKGSVCAFMTEIFRKSGLKAGAFISPHVVVFEERISVNGQMISREDVARLGNKLLDTDFGVNLTMFDYCLAMALMYFTEQDCDIMVIETGLGGRLDSTNAIGLPLATVITKIGYDHVAILGDKLEDIAREKAGIIKTGSHVFSEQQEEEAEAVIRDAADKCQVQLTFVTKEEIEAASKYNLSLLGVHQWENAAVAKLAAEYVLEKFINAAVTDGNKLKKNEPEIISALRETVWQGRMEILSQKPFFMVDGAHNGHGVLALRDSLKTLYPCEKFHMIMAVMADKDYKAMVEELLPYAEDFVAVNMDNSRALQAKDLAEFINSRGVKADCVDSVEEALKTLRADTKNLAFGSLYFIGEIKERY
ncbi:MAG: bifunctional folylpolyglutamate synthase/dihydrofolate synthase [Lachnobacterium sp.]|nr:bifunctional folylpolyglutamate synthase/dihydrofolate synthase [Lachnobacterium sp.]